MRSRSSSVVFSSPDGAAAHPDLSASRFVLQGQKRPAEHNPRGDALYPHQLGQDPSLFEDSGSFPTSAFSFSSYPVASTLEGFFDLNAASATPPRAPDASLPSLASSPLAALDGTSSSTDWFNFADASAPVSSSSLNGGPSSSAGGGVGGSSANSPDYLFQSISSQPSPADNNDASSSSFLVPNILSTSRDTSAEEMQNLMSLFYSANQQPQQNSSGLGTSSTNGSGGGFTINPAHVSGSLSNPSSSYSSPSGHSPAASSSAASTSLLGGGRQVSSGRPMAPQPPSLSHKAPSRSGSSSSLAALGRIPSSSSIHQQQQQHYQHQRGSAPSTPASDSGGTPDSTHNASASEHAPGDGPGRATGSRGGGGGGGDMPTVCSNCHTTNTPLWRRDPEGNPLCNVSSRLSRWFAPCGAARLTPAGLVFSSRPAVSFT